MEPLNEIIALSRNPKHLKLMAEKISEDFIKQGYTKTNLGWLKKEWIHKGIEMQAIVICKEYSKPPEYLDFKVKAEVVEYEESRREGRRLLIEKKQKLTTHQHSVWDKWVGEQRRALCQLKNTTQSDSNQQLNFAQRWL